MVHVFRQSRVVLTRAAADTSPPRLRSLLRWKGKTMHLERNPDRRNFDIGKRGWITCLIVEYSDVRSLPPMKMTSWRGNDARDARCLSPLTMLGVAMTHEALMQAANRKKVHRSISRVFPAGVIVLYNRQHLVRTKSG